MAGPIALRLCAALATTIGSALGSTALQAYENARASQPLTAGLGQAVLQGARDGMAMALGGELVASRISAAGVAAAPAAARGVRWTYGAHKSSSKWASQMARRGWTPEQITEAMKSGERVAAENLVNKGNPASRYIHPTTHRSVVVDDVTREVIHVGGDGFKY